MYGLTLRFTLEAKSEGERVREEGKEKKEKEGRKERKAKEKNFFFEKKGF